MRSPPLCIEQIDQGKGEISRITGQAFRSDAACFLAGFCLPRVRREISERM
jgi:hypothetical protein